jgi:hypothetical protein
MLDSSTIIPQMVRANLRAYDSECNSFNSVFNTSLKYVRAFSHVQLSTILWRVINVISNFFLLAPYIITIHLINNDME